MSGATMRKAVETTRPEVVLIFPAGLPDSQKFRADAKARGQAVVGGSSLSFDPAAPAYDTWETLPYIHDPAFGARLAAVVAHHGVTAIYAPHEVISGVLGDILPTVAPG